MKFVIRIQTDVSHAVYEIEALNEKDAVEQARKMTRAVTGLPSQDIRMTVYGPYIKVDPDDVIRVPVAIQDIDGNFARGRIEVTDEEVEIYMKDYPNAFFDDKSTVSLRLYDGGLLLVVWGNQNNGPLIVNFDLLKWREEQDEL